MMVNKKISLVFLLSLIILISILGFVNASITGVTITNLDNGDYVSGIVTITWDLTGTDDANDRYNVDYSLGVGEWHTLTNPSLSPGETSYSWNTDSLNGKYRIRVQHFNDGLKNQDIITNLIIDNINPVASLSGISESYTNSDEITLNCNDENCATTKYYYFDSDSVCSSDKEDYTNSVSIDILTIDTTHDDYLCLWVEDLAGNSDYTETGSQLKVDAEDPTASLSITPMGLTQESSVTYTPDCEDTGGSELASCTTYVKFNGEVATIISTSETEQIYSMDDGDGTYTFYTVAIDNAGNSETSSTYEVEKDQTGPTITITNGETTIWNVGSSVPVETNCNDPNSCAEIK